MEIFAGSDSTLAQSMRAMVLNFWAQTGGLFGHPLQVVSGNVLIFIIFGAEIWRGRRFDEERGALRVMRRWPHPRCLEPCRINIMTIPVSLFSKFANFMAFSMEVQSC